MIELSAVYSVKNVEAIDKERDSVHYQESPDTKNPYPPEYGTNVTRGHKGMMGTVYVFSRFCQGVFLTGISPRNKENGFQKNWCPCRDSNAGPAD
jgi:hypothetical protein